LAFWRRSRRVEELIARHLELVERTVLKFQEALFAYLDEGRKRAGELAEQIQLREFVSRLADISDEIEDLSDQVEIIIATRGA
jgi:uncharacterized protein Yka (UPF0111/DUF47 family)